MTVVAREDFLPGGRYYVEDWPPQAGTTRPSPPGPLFSDPATQWFEQLLQQQVQQLQRPPQFSPQEQQFSQLLQRLMGQFGQGLPPMPTASFTPPNLAGLQSAVDQARGALSAPQSNVALQKLLGLSNVPIEWTPKERALYRTQAIEPIEAQRGAAKQRAVERASARGMGVGSGLLELDTRDIERSFDQMTGQASRQATLDELASQNQRRQMAISAAGAAAGAEQGANQLDLSRIGQSLGAAQLVPGMQMQQAGLQLQQGALGQQGWQLLQNAQNQQAGNLLGAAGLYGQQGAGLRAEEQQRLAQALGLAGLYADLPVQRMQAAQGVMTGQPTTQSLLSSLMSILGGGQWQQGFNAQQNAGLWGGIADVLNALGPLFGGQQQPPPGWSWGPWRPK